MIDVAGGVAGGYLTEQGGGGQTPEGAKQGDKGSKLPPLKGVNTTWNAGDAVEVGFMLCVFFIFVI